MKVLVILIVLVGIGIWATIQFGGFTGMDPAAQAAELQEKIKPGMSWEDVVDYKAPRKFYPVSRESMTREGQPLDFDRATMKKDLADGGFSDGFNFKYTFSADEQYQVNFDGSGTVRSIQKNVTFTDLATGKTWQR